jgi:beta-glucuronidase
MKKIAFILSLFMIIRTDFAQPQSLIQNIEGRKTISLNGDWHIIIDPYETGFFNYRLDEDPNGFFKNAKPKNKSDRVEYDFDQSEILKVPGDWNSQKEKLFLYEGTVWYKKSFDYNKKNKTRLYIYFGAVNYDALVYINGEKLGEHVGGFTPFNFEITDKVKEGENFIVVKVNNKRLRDGVPTVNTDWWNYGGITRDVNLIEVPETFIRDYFIQLAKGSKDNICGWLQLDGNSLSQNVNIKIPEAGIDEAVKTDKNGYTTFKIKSKLTLWSPENPKLYDIVINSSSDTVKDKIGFRSIETKGSKIFLNGKEIFLRGISIHEEAPIRSGRAYSVEDAQMLLGWAKELGCNFVRLAHYPHNENMIRQAEQMGILVWSEIPVYWTILWDDEKVFANASNQLNENITRDKNRAPIILWSVGNETPRTDSRTKFMKKLADQAREMDSTRLITAATETHYINPNTIMIDDPLGKSLDVLGCNEYIGWYDGTPAKADTINWKTDYNKPLIFSEFGGGAKYGFHVDTTTIWSEEFQANLYKHQINMIKKISFLQGMTPWILMDFRSPKRLLPGIQDYYNRKGLITNKGEMKMAFYVLQDYYNSLKK